MVGQYAQYPQYPQYQEPDFFNKEIQPDVQKSLSYTGS